ncbi:MAG: restriction endonuclease, partial [Candidatus Beckwithbacteria bacterium]
MFYKKQSKDSLNRYVSLLTKLGSLSRLFSTNDVPYLPYRAVENVFCKVFDAKNHSRSDTS